MKYSILLLLSLLVLGCDDPSLDDPNSGIEEVVEPVVNDRQLSSIQVAFNTSNNITRDIDFEYNGDDLLSSITETGTIDQVTIASYGNGNQLQVLSTSENMQPAIDVTISYGNDDTTQANFIITLNYTNLAGILIEKVFHIDIQNRFDRIVTTQTDTSGIVTQIEDLRFQYSQNFNVIRIEEFDSSGLFITGFSDFTYNFNNNPFVNMNDIIRLFMFDDFVSYSRFLPATRMDYDLSTGTSVLERSVDYQYTFDDDGYPISRDLMVTEGAMTSTYFEFFNYRP